MGNNKSISKSKLEIKELQEKNVFEM